MSHHDHGDHHGHHNHGPPAVADLPTSTTINPMMDHDHMDHGNHDMSAVSGSENGSGHHNMMMHMYFHGGTKETILFQCWSISEVEGLILSMLGVFLLAFFYEALKFYREHLYRHSFKTVEVNTLSVPVENGGTEKETHKTVTISAIPGASNLYASPEVNPIFISQANCECPKSPSTEDVEDNGDNDESKSQQTIENNNASTVPSSCRRSSRTKVLLPSRSFHYKVKILSCMHIMQTCLHVIQVILSYFLMLIFMTYNVYLCLAVAVGAGAGYFVFGWKKSLVVDITEHCH